MIETIISALASGAASEASKELFKHVVFRIKSLFKDKVVPEGATRAVEKLERGEVDQAALRQALAVLSAQEITSLQPDVDALRRQLAISIHNTTVDFSGATITGSTVTGVVNTFNK